MGAANSLGQDVDRGYFRWLDSWKKTQEGLDKAGGALDPSQSYAQWMTQQGPGAAENYWSQYGSQFGQPTAASGALDQYKQWMQRPGASEGAYGNATGMLGSSNANDIYAGFGGALSGRRSDAEMWNQSNAGAYGAPSQSEDLNKTLQDTYASMTAGANKRNSDRLAELTKAGRAEEFRPETVSQAQAFQRALPQMQGTANLDSGAGEFQGYYRGANDTTDYYGSQMGALKGPGSYEQFVTSDITGRNPQKDMLMDEGLAKVNQEMARRGAFRSGAADTAIGKMVGQFEADDYQNRANRAQSAQQMQLGRIGQGTATSTASAQGKLAQGSALQGLAGDRDAEKRARIDQLQRSTDSASSEGLANQRLGLDSAAAASAALNARLKTSGDLESTSNRTLLDILSGRQSSAGQADDQLLARLAGGRDAAYGADKGLLDRLAGLGAMGGAADKSALDRSAALYGMGSDQDKLALARFGQLGDMSGQQDQAWLAKMMGGGSLAGGAQGAKDARLNGAFDALSKVGMSKAQLIQNFYEMGGRMEGQAFEDYLNVVMARAGVRSKEDADRTANQFKAIALPINAVAAAKGK